MKSEHKLQFKWVDDTNVDLMDVMNPFYHYKTGDKIDISYYEFDKTTEKLAMKNIKVEVVDISHEIIESMIFEQITTVHIRKV